MCIRWKNDIAAHKSSTIMLNFEPANCVFWDFFYFFYMFRKKLESSIGFILFVHMWAFRTLGNTIGKGLDWPAWHWGLEEMLSVGAGERGWGTRGKSLHIDEVCVDVPFLGISLFFREESHLYLPGIAWERRWRTKTSGNEICRFSQNLLLPFPFYFGDVLVTEWCTWVMLSPLILLWWTDAFGVGDTYIYSSQDRVLQGIW